MEHTGHRRFGGVYWKACPHSSATWDKTYDWPDKKIIAVIGDGSSGIQVSPALQPKAARIVNYVCHPTWVSVNLSPNITKDRMRANLSIARKRKRSSEMIPKHSWSTGNGLTARRLLTAYFILFSLESELTMRSANTVYRLMLFGSEHN